MRVVELQIDDVPDVVTRAAEITVLVPAPGCGRLRRGPRDEDSRDRERDHEDDRSTQWQAFSHLPSS
jgi:hypothetical protein